MTKRIGVVAVVVEKRREAAPRINRILSDYAHLIIGRMGIPYREQDISVISLIIEGTPDQVRALTGKLGNIEGVILKSALTPRESL